MPGHQNTPMDPRFLILFYLFLSNLFVPGQASRSQWGDEREYDLSEDPDIGWKSNANSFTTTIDFLNAHVAEKAHAFQPIVFRTCSDAELTTITPEVSASHPDDPIFCVEYRLHPRYLSQLDIYTGMMLRNTYAKEPFNIYFNGHLVSFSDEDAIDIETFDPLSSQVSMIYRSEIQVIRHIQLYNQAWIKHQPTDRYLQIIPALVQYWQPMQNKTLYEQTQDAITQAKSTDKITADHENTMLSHLEQATTSLHITSFSQLESFLQHELKDLKLAKLWSQELLDRGVAKAHISRIKNSLTEFNYRYGDKPTVEPKLLARRNADLKSLLDIGKTINSQTVLSQVVDLALKHKQHRQEEIAIEALITLIEHHPNQKTKEKIIKISKQITEFKPLAAYADFVLETITSHSNTALNLATVASNVNALTAIDRTKKQILKESIKSEVALLCELFNKLTSKASSREQLRDIVQHHNANPNELLRCDDVTAWAIIGCVILLRDRIFMLLGDELPKNMQFGTQFQRWFNKCRELRNQFAHDKVYNPNYYDLLLFAETTKTNKDMIIRNIEWLSGNTNAKGLNSMPLLGNTTSSFVTSSSPVTVNSKPSNSTACHGK